MKIVRGTAPFIRNHRVSVTKTMLNVLIALAPLSIFAIYVFGLNAFLIILASVLTAFITELVISFIQVRLHCSKKKIEFKFDMLSITDLTAIVTGLIFALCLSSAVPLPVVIIGSFVSITLGKLVFGGLGNNIFNPAALGRVFVGLSFSTFIGEYFLFQNDNIQLATDALTGSTALMDGFGNTKILNLFLGVNTSGSLGEVSSLLILVGAIYLIVTKAADFRLIVSTLLSFAFFALIAGVFAHNLEASAFEYMAYNLFAGAIMFGAVFMVTDPVSAPFSSQSRIIYGILIAAVTIIIRIFGALPEGMVFAILIVNSFSSLLDYSKFTPSKYTLKYIIGVVILISIISLIIAIGVSNPLGSGVPIYE